MYVWMFAVLSVKTTEPMSVKHKKDILYNRLTNSL